MKLILNAITETGEVMIQKLLDALSSAIDTENLWWMWVGPEVDNRAAARYYAHLPVFLRLIRSTQGA